MSDLISRSAVIELLRKNMTSDIQDQITTENNINLISSIPTAYSVEKVVAELLTCDPQEMMSEKQRNVLNYAIDIVRKGGVE